MRKIVASFLIASSLFELSAKELKDEKLQLLAKNIDAKESIIVATGDVVAYSLSYYLSADKIVYDKEKEIIELFDNVLIIKDNKIQTQSNYAYLDMKNDIMKQDPVFLMDSTSNIWSNAKESNKKSEKIELDSSIISSCDCIDPFWSIKSSSMDYDTEAMWINTYNTRLYIKNIPVFYTPYFGFPTNTKRRTGLLIPTLNFSSGEGFGYFQPIYIAPKDNYDIELVPQIRTSRGYGNYAYFRYADSPNSMLSVKTGYFKENNSYKTKEKIENSEHFGLDIDYSRRDIFKQEATHSDGVYTAFRYLNDIEYINLEHNANSSSDKKVESKFNYFYNTPNYYAGAYAKYYIDTSKKSNSNTLQELPQLQFHSYNKELFLENLIYSVDTKYQNLTRSKGLNANVYEISLPLSYSKNFADDYVYVSVENKITFNRYEYSNSNIKYDNGNLIQNLTTFKVGSDLIKPYTDYIHTLNLSASYDIPKNLKKDGDLYNITVTKDDNIAKYNELNIVSPLIDSKTINLNLNQSLYDTSSLEQFINHKMSQSIIYDSVNEAKFQDYENYIKLNHKFGTVSGKVTYNMEDNKIVEKSLNSTFKYEDFTLTAGYYNTVKTNNEFNTRDDLESYRVSTSYKLAKDYSISYYENHNLKEKIKNKQGIALNIDDMCWNLDLRLEKDITPRNKYNESLQKYESTRQTVVYATLMLKPIGGLRHKYKVSENESR